MEDHVTDREKVEKPSTHFEHPHEVLADNALSEEQKRKALEMLEQDARQLAEASAEGMSGGEPTRLHEVLVAKNMIELPPVAQAYEVVKHDLTARLGKGAAGADKACLEQALACLKAVNDLSAA